MSLGNQDIDLVLGVLTGFEHIQLDVNKEESFLMPKALNPSSSRTTKLINIKIFTQENGK